MHLLCAAIPMRFNLPTIFFPFTIKIFYCSGSRFPLSHNHPSTNFPSSHFSHPAAPTLLQPSPSPGLTLPFTSAIQSSLSLLPSFPSLPYLRGNSAAIQPHCISQQLNHHLSTNHATQSKLTLLRRRQHIEKLRVEEL